MQKTKYCFIQDNNCHWFLIQQVNKELFYQWVDDMENGNLTDIDFDRNRINNPSDFCFTNPINCFDNLEYGA